MSSGKCIKKSSGVETKSKHFAVLPGVCDTGAAVGKCNFLPQKARAEFLDIGQIQELQLNWIGTIASTLAISVPDAKQ